MNIFHKYRIKCLIKDLKYAEKILSEYSGGYSGKHISAEEFHKDLMNRIEKLERNDESVLVDLCIWLAPTCQWNDFVGDIALGERIIYQRIVTS